MRLTIEESTNIVFQTGGQIVIGSIFCHKVNGYAQVKSHTRTRIFNL